MAFKDGDIVDEGDLLFQIDPRPFDATVARDQAGLAVAGARAKRAAADLARAGRLIKGKTITQEDYDRILADHAEAAAAVKQAEANLTKAKLDREYSTVTAAVGGRVSRAMITKGNLVNGNAGSSVASRPEDIVQLKVRNRGGDMVPLGTIYVVLQAVSDTFSGVRQEPAPRLESSNNDAVPVLTD